MSCIYIVSFTLLYLIRMNSLWLSFFTMHSQLQIPQYFFSLYEGAFYYTSGCQPRECNFGIAGALGILSDQRERQWKRIHSSGVAKRIRDVYDSNPGTFVRPTETSFIPQEGYIRENRLHQSAFLRASSSSSLGPTRCRSHASLRD